MTPFANLGLQTSRKGKRVKLWRNESIVTVNTTDTKLLGSNPRRWGVIFGTPVATVVASAQSFTSKTVWGTGIDDTTLGAKLTYTTPANTQSILTGMYYFQKTGAGVAVAFNAIPNGGATTKIKNNPVTDNMVSFGLPLLPGDAVEVRVVTVGTGTIDAWIGVQEFTTPSASSTTDNTVFISTDGPAAVNSGMPLHPGNDPFMMTYEHIGQAIREEIRAIATSTAVGLTIWDIFEVDCPCTEDEYNHV